MATKKITLNELRSLVKQIIKETQLSYSTDEDPIDDYYDSGEDFYIEDYVRYDYDLDSILSDFYNDLKKELRNIINNTEFKRINDIEDEKFLEELYQKVLKPLKGFMSDNQFQYYVDKMVKSKLKDTTK